MTQLSDFIWIVCNDCNFFPPISSTKQHLQQDAKKTSCQQLANIISLPSSVLSCPLFISIIMLDGLVPKSVLSFKFGVVQYCCCKLNEIVFELFWSLLVSTAWQLSTQCKHNQHGPMPEVEIKMIYFPEINI